MPAELIIHYIVKDYQRMALMYDTMKEKIISDRKTIQYLQKELLETSQLKQKLHNAEQKSRVLEMKYNEFKQEKEKYRKQFVKLKARFNQLKQVFSQLPAFMEEEDEA